MKIAIVHDWLTTFAGAEKVLEQILICYPDAKLFTVVDFCPEEMRSNFLLGKKSTTTFIQKLPFARTKYRSYLPWMPLAIEQLDLTKYDLIISSSHAVAKGVITGPNQLHISYVHSPMRYAWDLQYQYLKESNLDTGIKSWIARKILHNLRIWDLRTANGVDEFIANSGFIERRIWKTYRRRAQVIYPPVATELFSLKEQKEDFYLTVSRLVPYKKIDLIVEAFTKMPDKKLVVIGDGPMMKKIRQLATNNIELLGNQPQPVVIDFMQRAKAFIFTALEDFGIAPVEAQACGTPVIAFGQGGCLETVRDISKENPTGLFFTSQTSEKLIQAINQFESLTFNPLDCRNNALCFAAENFRCNFTSFVGQKWLEFTECLNQSL